MDKDNKQGTDRHDRFIQKKKKRKTAKHGNPSQKPGKKSEREKANESERYKFLIKESTRGKVVCCFGFNQMSTENALRKCLCRPLSPVLATEFNPFGMGLHSGCLSPFHGTSF